MNTENRRVQMPCALVAAGVVLSLWASTETRAAFIYTAKSSNSTISQYTTAGSFVTSHATGGNMETVSFDVAGNVYTTDLNGGVEKFDPSLTTSSNLSTTGTTPFYYGTAVDSSGNVYFSTDADTGASSDIKIYRYLGGAGNPVLFSDTGTNTSFSVHNSVAIDPSTQNVFLADFGNNQIIEYNTSGSPIQTFTSGISGPWGIAVDHLGDLYVSNTNTGTLEKIIISSGVTSNVATGLTGAEGVAVDNQNNVYEVVESSTGGLHGSVIEFTSTGTPLGEIINTGAAFQDYITVTPEPASLASLALGSLPLLLRRPRR